MRQTMRLIIVSGQAKRLNYILTMAETALGEQAAGDTIPKRYWRVAWHHLRNSPALTRTGDAHRR